MSDMDRLRAAADEAARELAEMGASARGLLDAAHLGALRLVDVARAAIDVNAAGTDFTQDRAQVAQAALDASVEVLEATRAAVAELGADAA